ncbi:hypothetical protein KCU98_g8161, partial [Aureobasidium melanogenum]
MSWKVSEATLADVPAITSIYSRRAYAIPRALPRVFERACAELQPSDTDHRKLTGPRTSLLPKDEADGGDHMAQAQEAYEDSIAPGMNSGLIVEFRHRVIKLRNDVLRGRRHYLLLNIGTIKTERQKGAATALVKQMVDAADREHIYLDTVSEGPARRLFDKLGFEEVGRFEIDLSKFGGVGVHTHVGMIRWAWKVV